jgi:hypothetical protein
VNNGLVVGPERAWDVADGLSHSDPFSLRHEPHASEITVAKRDDARERILGTAYRPCSWHGLNAVGVDRRDEFEGCLFVNSLVETHDRSSPVRAATIVGMSRVRGLALELAGLVLEQEGLSS